MKIFKRREKRTFLSSSEFVSLGHSDRVSDLCAAIVIDDIQHKDGPNSHAAVEVFLTHDTVTFGGEVKTSMSLDLKYLRSVVSKAFKIAGYIPEMRKFWSKAEVCLPSNLFIYNKIEAQSPDIALGTTDKGAKSGYNDQGIAMSSAENTNKFRLGVPHLLAQCISQELSDLSRVTILNPTRRTQLGVVLGPDNKVVVTVKVKEDGFTPIEVTGVTIAVAHSSLSDIEKVKEIAITTAVKVFEDNKIPVSEDCVYTVNGTGRFVIHGNISDCSMTGRKLSVNNPSAGPLWSNKLIGGGSLIKCHHASDLMLNVACRLVSNVIVASELSSYAVTLVSCSIGAITPQSVQIIGDAKFMRKYYTKCQEFFTEVFKWDVATLANQFDMFGKFSFVNCVKDNFFGNPNSQPWESEELIGTWSKKLQGYMAG